MKEKRKRNKRMRIERIPDTPENVARAMFGMKPERKQSEGKTKETKLSYDNR